MRLYILGGATLLACAQESVSAGVYSKASDAFMFGMLVYETLTGLRPFDRDSDTEAGDRIARGERPPRPAAGAAATAQPAMEGDAQALRALWALHERCTEREPVARPALSDVLSQLELASAELE